MDQTSQVEREHSIGLEPEFVIQLNLTDDFFLVYHDKNKKCNFT